VLALASALSLYQRNLTPRVRKELRGWEDAARTIPNPVLREAALSSLSEKGSNPEAIAVFAILAPKSRRASALRAMTALQVAIDYLDALGERPVDKPLESGLALHATLVEAVSPGAAPADRYRLHPYRDDGGYLAALAAACQGEVAALPSWEAVREPAQRAALRCGEGQSHTHSAAATGETGGLKAWATRQESPAAYRWWEVAAGASSSVAIHALIAAAADPETSVDEAELIDAAYFPPIGALTVLLDDLIDFEEDAAGNEHNYMNCYPSSEVAAERLSFIASEGRAATARLRHRHRHAAILAGVAGFYLSDPAARSERAAPIRKRMLRSLGGAARLVLIVMRVRRG